VSTLTSLANNVYTTCLSLIGLKLCKIA